MARGGAELTLALPRWLWLRWLGWVGLAGADLTWPGLDWTGLGWRGGEWDRIGSDWIRSDRIGFGEVSHLNEPIVWRSGEWSCLGVESDFSLGGGVPTPQALGPFAPYISW